VSHCKDGQGQKTNGFGLAVSISGILSLSTWPNDLASHSLDGHFFGGVAASMTTDFDNPVVSSGLPVRWSRVWVTRFFLPGHFWAIDAA
jgi:hypothetical protein